MQMSFFLSPKAPVNGFILGAGPVLVFPTASDDLLGTEKWAAGPSGVILRQQGQWTYGMLTQHVWDYAGDDDRSSVNSTLLQPFASFTTHTATTFSLQAESVYLTFRTVSERLLNILFCFKFNYLRLNNYILRLFYYQ